MSSLGMVDMVKFEVAIVVNVCVPNSLLLLL